jgi:hypothetical protein
MSRGRSENALSNARSSGDEPELPALCNDLAPASEDCFTEWPNRVEDVEEDPFLLQLGAKDAELLELSGHGRHVETASDEGAFERVPRGRRKVRIEVDVARRARQRPNADRESSHYGVSQPYFVEGGDAVQESSLDARDHRTARAAARSGRT